MSHHGSSVICHNGASHMSHIGRSHMAHHGGSHLSHHGHYRAASVHGGLGSKTVSFSKLSAFSRVGNHCGGDRHRSQFSSYGQHSGWKNCGLLSINEKETMQLLNDRLASYLDKVQELEQENAQLERKICGWYENNTPTSLPDNSQFFRIIADLQSQISAATRENARIILQIDNARLAADDFRNKYEMEVSMTSSIQDDINSLRNILGELNRETCELRMQIQNLQEELEQMRRNHEEEVNSLRAQLGARVNVELNAAPSVDLNRALSEIREQYENLMERNMMEVESIFQQRSEELNRDVISGAEQLVSVSSEITDLKRCVQSLEIELQSQLSMTSALECTLAETQATYASQLGQLQDMINNVEGQLGQIRFELERQNQAYILLMDQTTRLEMEIATYKRLLDCSDIQITPQHEASLYRTCSPRQLLKYLNFLANE
ncbi:keratin, type I cytoskeletal 19-like [Discoglossus pictus]